MVTTQFNSKVKNFHLNNGIKFANGHCPLPAFLRNEGIIPQTNCVGMSQQNGVVERKN